MKADLGQSIREVLGASAVAITSVATTDAFVPMSRSRALMSGGRSRITIEYEAVFLTAAEAAVAVDRTIAEAATIATALEDALGFETASFAHQDMVVTVRPAKQVVAQAP